MSTIFALLFALLALFVSFFRNLSKLYQLADKPRVLMLKIPMKTRKKICDRSEGIAQSSSF